MKCSYHKLLTDLPIIYRIQTTKGKVIFTVNVCRNQATSVQCAWGNTSETVFYAPLTVHLGIILFNDQLDAHYIFLKCLSQFSICFPAFKCSSAEDSIVWIGYLVYVTLCRWHIPYIVLNNWISWWWTLECSKHVQNWNKHIQKRIVWQVGH